MTTSTKLSERLLELEERIFEGKQEPANDNLVAFIRCEVEALETRSAELEDALRDLREFVDGRLCDNPRTPGEHGECRARRLLLARPEWSVLG